MLTEKELLEKWESLTFTDDFMFNQVMHDEEICRQVVELILGIKIGKIEYLSTQEKQKTDPDSMAIIMDVYLRDENKVPEMLVIYSTYLLPGFLRAGAVSQGLNRDSLKLLNISQFSSLWLSLPTNTVLGFSQQVRKCEASSEGEVLGGQVGRHRSHLPR